MPSVRVRWIGIAVAALALLYASGLRSMFGVLITPLEHEFGYDRATLGTMGALSLFLYGAIGPFAGRFAGRWGAPPVLALGLLALGIGELFAANAHGLLALYVTIAVVVALGSGAVGMPSATSLAARWFTDKRGLVLGILAAGVSAGQILVIPPAQWLTDHSGWRPTLTVLGVGALLIALPAYLLIRDRGQRGRRLRAVTARVMHQDDRPGTGPVDRR